MAVIPDPNTIGKSNIAGVRYAENATLGVVASSARVEQVRVYEPPEWVTDHRYEMIDVERGSAIVPLLAMQAIVSSGAQKQPVMGA